MGEKAKIKAKQMGSILDTAAFLVEGYGLEGTNQLQYVLGDAASDKVDRLFGECALEEQLAFMLRVWGPEKTLDKIKDAGEQKRQMEADLYKELSWYDVEPEEGDADETRR